jgi:hypothetical protein
MKRWLTADDVLRDVEFEIAQGAISRDELGQGVQAVKEYQNKLRGEVFQASRQAGESREALSRLFQINDMLITLQQEMAAGIQTLQVDLRRVAALAAQGAPSTAGIARAPAAKEPGGEAAAGEVSDQEGHTESIYWRSSTEIENAMRSDALKVEPEVRSIGVPILSGLIQRVRTALHRLVLFYVSGLAKKQVVINQTYGDWILHMLSLQRFQQEQIDRLDAQLSALLSRAAENEH